MKMNKLTIPTILAATVMIAGMFAFMPIEQASTVHTTITLAGFEAGALGVGDIATGAITADALATDAALEIQTGVHETTSYAAGVDSTCVSDAPFLVHYTIWALANTETAVLGGSSGAALTYTATVATTIPTITGTVGGAATEIVTFTVGPAGLTTLTIVSGIGSTAACVAQ